MAEHEESDRLKESNEEYRKISKSLDPLISTFTNFHSEEQLNYMINRMFEYLDVDASGSITFEEMKSGLEKLPMEPALRFTYEDYEEFTRSLTLADENGDITKSGFLQSMLLEMKAYAFRNAAHQMDQAQKHDREDASDYLTSKVCFAIFSPFDLLLRRLASEKVSLCVWFVPPVHSESCVTGPQPPVSGRYRALAAR